MNRKTRSYIDRRIALTLVSAFGLTLLPRNGHRAGHDVVLGNRIIGQVRDYSDVEEWLENEGYIVDDEPAAEPVH